MFQTERNPEDRGGKWEWVCLEVIIKEMRTRSKMSGLQGKKRGVKMGEWELVPLTYLGKYNFVIFLQLLVKVFHLVQIVLHHTTIWKALMDISPTSLVYSRT